MIQRLLQNIHGRYAVFVVIALLLTAAIAGWYKPQTGKERTAHVLAPEEKIVEKIKRIEVPVTKVVAFNKTQVVKSLDLPDAIRDDAAKQVISNAEIPEFKGKTSVVTVLDTVTGKSEIIARQIPLPLIAFENNKELGLRYGMSTKRGQFIEVFGRWQFLRVGSIHASVYGEVNTNTEAMIAMEASYAF